MVFSNLQQTRPYCRNDSNVTTGRHKKTDCFTVEGTDNYCKTVLEAMGCYAQYRFCQEAHPSLTDVNIESGVKKR